MGDIPHSPLITPVDTLLPLPQSIDHRSTLYDGGFHHRIPVGTKVPRGSYGSHRSSCQEARALAECTVSQGIDHRKGAPHNLEVPWGP